MRLERRTDSARKFFCVPMSQGVRVRAFLPAPDWAKPPDSHSLARVFPDPAGADARPARARPGRGCGLTFSLTRDARAPQRKGWRCAPGWKSRQRPTPTGRPPRPASRPLCFLASWMGGSGVAGGGWRRPGPRPVCAPRGGQARRPAPRRPCPGLPCGPGRAPGSAPANEHRPAGRAPAPGA